MYYAENQAGEVIAAVRGETAVCPGCREELLGKAGEIVVTPYWSHRVGGDCDEWFDAGNKMSEWHRDWQALATRGRREAPMVRDGVRHRADIRASNGDVIEVQNSAISPAKIREREEFYGASNAMAWIWNTIEAKKSGRLDLLRSNDWDLPELFRRFTWNPPWRSIGHCGMRALLDLGQSWLLDAVITERNPFQGWGFLVPKSIVIGWINDGLPERPVDPRIAIAEKRRLERKRQMAERQKQQSGDGRNLSLRRYSDDWRQRAEVMREKEAAYLERRKDLAELGDRFAIRERWQEEGWLPTLEPWWETCGICKTQGLWAPQSQQRGTCERCHLAGKVASDADK